MELKLFAGGVPSEDFQKDLARFLDLDEIARAALRGWFQSAESFTPVDSQWIQKIADDSGLNLETANRMFQFVRFVLKQWSAQEISTEDILADIQSLGHGPERLEETRAFLNALSDVKGKVRSSLLRASYERIGLPTVDDVNIACDVRPMFAEWVYPPSVKGDGYQKLVGSTCVVVLEIVASRIGEKTRGTSFQLTEKDLEKLLEGLTRAKKQLEIVKSSLMRDKS